MSCDVEDTIRSIAVKRGGEEARRPCQHWLRSPPTGHILLLSPSLLHYDFHTEPFCGKFFFFIKIQKYTKKKIHKTERVNPKRVTIIFFFALLVVVALIVGGKTE